MKRAALLFHSGIFAAILTQATFAQTITQTEPDDSIGTANNTGLTAGSSGFVTAVGNSGDGARGPFGGNNTGDFDFFKLTAATGQTIYANINSNGPNDDFDSYIGLYYFSGGSATLVAENDDEAGVQQNQPENPLGYERSSQVRYTVPAGQAGEYYVCVSNYIDPVSLPPDPVTPAPLGPAYGRPGPYRVIIGLGMNAPVPDFLANYPLPSLFLSKIGSSPRAQGTLTLRNAGAAPWIITGATLTGPDAAKFELRGLTLPTTIMPNRIARVIVQFTASDTPGAASAAIDFTSNDPLDLSYPLTAAGSPVAGGGLFTMKQVISTVPLANLAAADNALAGNSISATLNRTPSVIDFGSGSLGNFQPNPAFPQAADNFAIQATGTFFIKTAGTYTFVINSDDGQRLRVDGADVIVNDVLQGAHNAFGSVALTAGMHTVEYTMFEAGGGEAAELGISQVPGAFTAITDTNWELLECYSPDPDGDLLPTQWETANGTNPAVADAAGDADGDGLTNIQEYNLGTRGNLADTDADGLPDPSEVNTHLSSPRFADTDADGLTDGQEINTFLTNPNSSDSDGDGFSDLAEIRSGTNPAVAASKPVNIALQQAVAVLGNNDAIDADRGVWKVNAGVVENVNDGNFASRVDTFGSGDANGFVGVLWPAPRAVAVDRIEVSHSVFFDGGWFGPNFAGPGSGSFLDATTHLIEPTVQVTTDLGETWTTVTHVSNYLDVYHGQPLPGVNFGNPTTAEAIFVLDTPQAGINGIRVIGQVGGTADSGFLGIFEVQVKEVAPVPTNLALDGSAIAGSHSTVDATMGVRGFNLNAGQIQNISDGIVTTRMDTFGVGGGANGLGFAGVLWPKPRTEAVNKISYNPSVFFDGGWFGPNGSNPGAGSVFGAGDLTEPSVQVTSNGGVTWQTVAATSDYLTVFTGHPLPAVAFGAPTTALATFTLTTPQTGIDGIRLIGTNGGPADGNGFLGVFEFGVGFVATADADGDGQSDAAEALAGTNPNDATSYLRVTASTVAGANVNLTWTSVPGKTYEVQLTGNLAAGPWETIVPSIPASVDAFTSTNFAIPGAPPGKLFFRVIVDTTP